MDISLLDSITPTDPLARVTVFSLARSEQENDGYRDEVGNFTTSRLLGLTKTIEDWSLTEELEPGGYVAFVVTLGVFERPSFHAYTFEIAPVIDFEARPVVGGYSYGSQI